MENKFRKEFQEIRKAFIENDYYRNAITTTYNLWAGGRSTGTSEGVTRISILDECIIEDKSIAVIRQNTASHNKSTVKLYLRLLNKLGIGYRFWKQEKEIRLNSGKSIYFLGLNDPEAIKSITADVPIGSVIFEEVTEFRKWEDIVTAMDSFRGHEDLKYHFLYNTTVPNHFIRNVEENWQKYLVEQPSILRTNITHNKFNTESFVQRMMALKDIDIKQYNVRVLGLWENLGDIVYEVDNSNYYENENMFHTISIGVDLGDVNATTFVALGFKNNYQDVYVLENYHYANKENEVKKSWNDYANDYVEFHNMVKSKYQPNLLTSQFETASGGVGFRQMILDKGIHVKGVKKDKISERVMYTNYLLKAKRLFLKKEHKLTEEFVNAQRDLKSTGNDYFRKDENDHSINAFEYALGKYIKYMGILETKEEENNNITLKEK